MVKRRKRDIYGNWVWEDDAEIQTPGDIKVRSEDPSSKTPTQPNGTQGKDDEELKLDWKDFVALSIASLETFLLPIVVFILILIGIVIGLSLFH